MPRKKKCRACGLKFTPKPDLQRAVVCSTSCGVSHGREMRAKAERKALRARKEGLRSKSDWLKLAQGEFNKFIRLRDTLAGRACISCGRHHQGQYHAGHYRPVGGLGAPLRFNELNCWLQCQPCNTHLSGNLIEYRIELIKRIGLDLVEWLEQDHTPQKWTIEEIKAIRAYYRVAIRDMTQYNAASTTNEGEY